MAPAGQSLVNIHCGRSMESTRSLRGHAPGRESPKTPVTMSAPAVVQSVGERSLSGVSGSGKRRSLEIIDLIASADG